MTKVAKAANAKGQPTAAPATENDTSELIDLFERE
jgi:hypothetical protein